MAFYLKNAFSGQWRIYKNTRLRRGRRSPPSQNKSMKCCKKKCFYFTDFFYSEVRAIATLVNMLNKKKKHKCVLAKIDLHCSSEKFKNTKE